MRQHMLPSPSRALPPPRDAARAQAREMQLGGAGSGGMTPGQILAPLLLLQRREALEVPGSSTIIFHGLRPVSSAVDWRI